MILNIIKIVGIVIPILLAVAYFTLAERKILGAIQRRRGPNVIGVYGLLQPLADGFKFLVKEYVLPSDSNKLLFIFSPVITFVISLMSWPVIPFNQFSVLSDINTSLLYIYAISSLGVYGIIMSGWSSNSKYAFLGALRSTAQMVSYEISIGMTFGFFALLVGSLNLQVIIESQQNCWNIVSFLPLFLVFFICGLAETNRHPFDLPEAESELVSGYNVEYSSMSFALFSLGEYSNMLLMSSLTTILFFGGWLPIFFLPNSISFGLKICFFVVLFIFMRAAFPRYRYDQLMNLGWKVFLPVVLCYYVVFAIIINVFNYQPL
jgi:NADH-quinone oxidoreductase subunit H